MKKLLLILLCLPMIGFGQLTYVPNVYVKTLAGENFNIKNLNNNGNPIVISFWATWCKPCKKELNAIAKVYDDWQEKTGVKLIAISIDDTRSMSKVAPYVNASDWDYEVYLDPKGHAGVAMGVSTIPHTFLLNGNNEIVWQHKGYIDGDEDELFSQIDKLPLFSAIESTKSDSAPPESNLSKLIKKFVEEKVTEWQQKGEFEKTTDYLERIHKKNRTVKIKEFQEAALKGLKVDFLNSIDFSNIELGKYDADNETFLLKDKKLGDLVISVPIREAQEFKKSFSFLKYSNPKCVIIDDKFVLSHVILTPILILGGVDAPLSSYTYSLLNSQDYVITDIDYEFSSIEIDDISSVKKIKSSNISTNKLKVGESSVNINIPTNKKVKNRYALIIGNEDYTSFQRTLNSEQNVDYAVNDATIFKKYCLKTLGVKEDNMFFLTDATAIDMNRKIKLVSKLIKKLGNKAELIVYYAGHGYPDETTKVPYLIPVDVSGTDLSYAIKLEDLYRDLGNTNAQVTIFLDACFTGGGRNSGLVASRGVKVKPKQGTLNGNIVVFSASSGDQSALPYHKEGHGMFTYHLLKKLQESKGKVSMGELADYIHDKVSIQSLKTNEKEQDPAINTSSKVENDWRNWGF